MQQLNTFINAILTTPNNEFKLLERIITRLTLQKKEFFLQKNKICKSIAFVNSGSLRMYYVDLQSNEINCRFTLENNFMVDYQSFLQQKPSNYYWQAMENTELLLMQYDAVQQLYKQSAHWEKFGRLIAESVYLQVNARIEMIQFYTPEQRYNLLLQQQPQLFHRFSQFQLSSYLGIKPQSLSRIRKRIISRH